jgi:hypothetical protein
MAFYFSEMGFGEQPATRPVRALENSTPWSACRSPKTFVWTAAADLILGKVKRLL